MPVHTSPLTFLLIFSLDFDTFTSPPSGCLYGDGYIKVFAGESAYDDSQTLAFEDGDFGSDRSIVRLF